MLILAINSIFAYIFFRAAHMAYARGWPLLQTGWLTIATEIRKPDYRQNVTSRNAISIGGRFLIGGLFWLLAALVSSGVCLYCAVQVVWYLGLG